MTLPSIPKHYDNRLLWHSRIPEKVSIFMWRLFNNALPLPLNLQKMNISLAPKCPFCPDVDTMEHIFWRCRMVYPTWQWFGRTLEVYDQTNLLELVQHWWSRKSSLKSLAFSIPAAICWFAWKTRNAALFSGTCCRPDKFQWEVQIFLISMYHMRAGKLLGIESLLLRRLGLM
ncbi:hypothetical protein HPP92_018365 [Vanilla planifolia]|uniref:Reverse transcriptase zinc-binding domain-containing protein n=1 Tax=Vanilla planifolia TaxID=51239 RepID=A0A835Q9N2_VANPL|nr:hypothetical protein HPP92_018365 [Vanilla planifolia]